MQALHGRAIDFVAHLYQSCLQVDSSEYIRWSVGEIGDLIPFDAAIMGTGTLKTHCYHSVYALGLPENYATILQDARSINLQLSAQLEKLSSAVNSSETFADKAFYQSDYYSRVCQPFGIERILGVAMSDAKSGLYTDVSLYRNSRDNPFTTNEKILFELIAPHLAKAGSHSFFLQNHLRTRSENTPSASVLCDRFGVIHDADELFPMMIEAHYPGWQGPILPADMNLMLGGEEILEVLHGLVVSIQPHDESYLVSVREARPEDSLSRREREVVDLVVSGLAYKEVGRELDIATSTVATLLNRAYLKLGVRSRSELATMINKEAANSSPM